MLSKQSIRKEVTIYLNGEIINKDEMIEISKDFSEKEEARFRKMIKQGGNLKVGENRYEIVRNENKTRNSKGDYESPFKQQFVDDYE
mgnify:CR=1 FL=1|tara:strand:- start:10 stop:270 length:261 start_codon:yes stop_codon:yes gene_type:complete